MYIIHRIPVYIVLILLQMFFFNNIHLFGHAVPLVYILAIINMPKNTPRWKMLVLGFVLGLAVDTTVNTPGVAASALTLVAFIHKPLLSALSERVDADMMPSMKSMGNYEYSVFSAIMSVVYCTVYFIFMQFTFMHPVSLFLDIAGSSLVTWLLVVVHSYLTKR